jgi:glycosyltransferase involved in cell wall biosynthesis
LEKALLDKADVLLVQGEDPWQDPTGGIVAFTKCLLRAFGHRLAVAAPSEESMPVGCWFPRPFEGRELPYFNLGPLGLKQGKKPLIPAKMHVYRRIEKYMEALHASGVRNLLLDSAEALFAAKWYLWDSVCYRFPGVSNPVALSRYRWARRLGGLYERMLVQSLRAIGPDAIIAAADDRAIAAFRRGSGRVLDAAIMHSFPTRVDTSVFYPESRDAVREELHLDPHELLLVVSGRLNWIKGWPLLLDVLATLLRDTPPVRLIFVGDGEDRGRIARRAARLGLGEHVTLTGALPQRTVRQYLNAADVCVVASHVEGWSQAMLEILACGRPLVTTDVSGAGAMIRDGENGFIVHSRDPQPYASAVRKAAQLTQAREVSVAIAEQYSIQTLSRDLGRIWKPLAPKSDTADLAGLPAREAA